MDEFKKSETNGMCLVPRAEYDELVKARMGIDLIGSTLNVYGGDDTIVKSVCKRFGYEYKEETP